MQVTIWGVRGGIASSGPHTAHYGGNTPCVSVYADDGGLLVLDAGTGIRGFGEQLTQARNQRVVHLFLSHFHWDHVQGLPFFGPMWDRSFEINIYAAHAPDEVERAVRAQFAAPFFPVGMQFTKAKVRFHDVREIASVGSVRVQSFDQYHPQGSTGYRLEESGRALVYATDSERGMPDTDAALMEHANGADVLLLDAQYTPEEIVQRAGWGHGDWRRACDVASSAGVKRLMLFHHDPSRCDGALHSIDADAKQVFAAAEAAREGTSFRL